MIKKSITIQTRFGIKIKVKNDQFSCHKNMKYFAIFIKESTKIFLKMKLEITRIIQTNLRLKIVQKLGI